MGLPAFFRTWAAASRPDSFLGLAGLAALALRSFFAGFSGLVSAGAAGSDCSLCSAVTSDRSFAALLMRTGRLVLVLSPIQPVCLSPVHRSSVMRTGTTEPLTFMAYVLPTLTSSFFMSNLRSSGQCSHLLRHAAVGPEAVAGWVGKARRRGSPAAGGGISRRPGVP